MSAALGAALFGSSSEDEGDTDEDLGEEEVYEQKKGTPAGVLSESVGDALPSPPSSSSPTLVRAHPALRKTSLQLISASIRDTCGDLRSTAGGAAASVAASLESSFAVLDANGPVAEMAVGALEVEAAAWCEPKEWAPKASVAERLICAAASRANARTEGMNHCPSRKHSQAFTATRCPIGAWHRRAMPQLRPHGPPLHPVHMCIAKNVLWPGQRRGG